MLFLSFSDPVFHFKRSQKGLGPLPEASPAR